MKIYKHDNPKTYGQTQELTLTGALLVAAIPLGWFLLMISHFGQ